MGDLRRKVQLCALSPDGRRGLCREYTALIEGLKLALERGVRRLEHRSDSQLLVRQLEGLYKVKSVPLARLHDQARSLVKAFESFISRHVPREQNLRADRLANLALDEQEKSAQ